MGVRINNHRLLGRLKQHRRLQVGVLEIGSEKEKPSGFSETPWCQQAACDHLIKIHIPDNLQRLPKQ